MSRLKVFLRDKNKKSYFKIALEALRFSLLKGELPHYYFGKFLYRKNVTDIANYLSIKETDVISLSKKYHKYEHASILRNKLSFALYCEKNNIRVPTLVGFNYANKFYDNGNCSAISTKKELFAYFRSIFEKFGIDAIFIKPIGEMGGKGCVLLKRELLEAQVDEHYEMFLRNSYIHQQVVRQHEKLDQIFPNSLNTIRFDTFLDQDGKGHILGAFIRFGAGDSFVDNASSGGFYVPVKLEDGTMKKDGMQLMRYGGNVYTAHPDTDFVFGGFVIPFFKEACDLVHLAIQFIPDKIIGWDIAISEEGPVLIEGNDNNSIFMGDIAYGGYLKHPLFQEILDNA